MFDEGKYLIHLEQLPTEYINNSPFFLFDLLFVPRLNPKNGEIKYYESEYDNLHLKLIGSSLYIENSISGYGNKNNVKDLSYSELVSKCNKIFVDKFNTPLNKVFVKKIALSLTVLIDINELELFNIFKRINKSEFNKLYKKSKVWGIKASLTDYIFKIYSKTIESKLHHKITVENYLYRFEWCINNSRYFKEYPTVEDIIKIENINDLFLDYFKIFDKIVKIVPINYSILKPNEIVKIQAFQDNRTIQLLNTHFPESNKKFKSECKKIIEKATNPILLKEIRTELVKKYNSLLSC